jgi:hypothetical protein
MNFRLDVVCGVSRATTVPNKTDDRARISCGRIAFEVTHMKYALAPSVLILILGTSSFVYAQQEKGREEHTQEARPAQHQAHRHNISMQPPRINSRSRSHSLHTRSKLRARNTRRQVQRIVVQEAMRGACGHNPSRHTLKTAIEGTPSMAAFRNPVTLLVSAVAIVST